MLKLLMRNHRLVRKRVVTTNYLKEYRDWKAEYKAAISKHRQDFWEIQTEVENDWIEKYNKNLVKKSNRKASKHREAVIKIAKNTIRLQNLRDENNKRHESNLKAEADRYANDLFRKKELIEILNLESKNWITLDNYKELITENLLIPESLNNSQYYTKLRELSLIAGLGKVQPASEYYNNREETLIKNKLITALFSDVKSLIKQITYTPLQKLFEDFESVRAQLNDYPDKLLEIGKKYSNIAQAWKAKEKSNKEILISRLHKQVDYLYRLARKWNEYISIAKMDDVEIRLVYSRVSNEQKIVEAVVDQEDWDYDFQDSNLETSDAFFDEGKIDEEEFKKSLDGLEADSLESQDELNFNFGDDDSENKSNKKEKKTKVDQKVEVTEESAASDFDMYDGTTHTINPPNLKTLDDLMAEVMQEINTSKDLFQNQESIDPEQLEQAINAEEYSPVFSIVKLKESIEIINDRDLDLQSKWKRGEILKCIDMLINTKIEEPHMLLRVFKHHRYDPPVFK